MAAFVERRRAGKNANILAGRRVKKDIRESVASVQASFP
jgi:hypothetical protein